MLDKRSDIHLDEQNDSFPGSITPTDTHQEKLPE
jgi:hypothetical protein